MPAKYSPERFLAVFWSRVKRGDQSTCWEWTATRFPDGYGCMKYHGKNVGTHRIVWEIHHGPIPTGKEVCHSCDNPPCCNPNHLSLGTRLENQQDKAKKGRTFKAVGTDQSQAKLTDEIVREIRRIYAPGKCGISMIARRFGVARSLIYRVLRRESWTHIE